MSTGSDFGIGSNEVDVYEPMPGCNAPHRHGLDCTCALKLLAMGAPAITEPPTLLQAWSANRLSHTIRYSDSSLYDSVCTTCGARDWVPGEDETARYSCEQFQKLKETHNG